MIGRKDFWFHPEIIRSSFPAFLRIIYKYTILELDSKIVRRFYKQLLSFSIERVAFKKSGCEFGL
jgi:hypothetical protein